jgi:fructose-bisphosphate aldolase class II
MFVSPQKFYEPAYGRYAVGAFSVNTLEQILGVLRGADAAAAPVIVQVSAKAHDYAGSGVLEAAIHAAARNLPKVPYAVHLDHGDEVLAHRCIDTGLYSSVMVDASMLAFEENIAVTKRVVEHAHLRGIAVEAELGRLGGKEDDIDVDASEAYLTDPKLAQEFVARTCVDSLAVAVGTSHGIHKFHGQRSLHLERLAQIQAALPRVPLVLHGASSVSPAEVARVNSAGGKIAVSAHGVPEEQYAQASLRGISKINVDTDLRLVWARTFRETFRDHPDNIDPRNPGSTFSRAVADLVAHHSRLFGCAGRAGEFNL